MEPRMFKFPHIDKYADIVGQLKHDCLYAGTDESGNPFFDENRPLKSYEFTGTVNYARLKAEA